MKPYDVTITETLSLTVNIEAENRAEAERIASIQWRNSEYILDADHFKGVTFRARQQERERAHERERDAR